ncbi:shikimate dehydrogenase [Gimesia panareensis]|uniref:Shikimate dehydrogenase (NADP(+)) n=1 Tax=Gimesia panareensis TaxID=2527978 RepID=A0A518FZ92_9PLAN|nr:shikimate dehydrogenase [Gimesia panareensis]QDU53787.1 Quinate/shikimate dehydrogenase [Gimesia panareensis]QDV21687.1 Quinate/shikimate dehydrogenase [Gimesia panareensis]
MNQPLNFKQELTCVFGQPVAENPTQCMMEAAYNACGLEWRYLTIEVAPENLAQAVGGLRAMGFRGANLTIPHKVEVIQYLDGISDAAAMMGAVNCIVCKDDQLLGENTDGKGFVQSLKEVTDPAGKKIVMFGAGGAARAIGVETALAGAAEITIVNRSTERGEALAQLLREKTSVPATFTKWDDDYTLAEDVDVVINATSIGLYPDVDAVFPLDFASLKSNMIVSDVIPNPPETHLLREAAKAGCTTLDGLGMLVNQGVIGFQLWTGVDPDPKVMRAALEEVFGVE